MQDADIFVFLLSRHFIASPECMREWKRAHYIQADQKRPRFRIPVIVSDCSWRDLLADDDIKALPLDGQAIKTFSDPEVAWRQVYDGIKSVVSHLRNHFSPRSDFLDRLQGTDIMSQAPAKLDDLFVFPPLSRYQPRSGAVHELEERMVTNVDDLLTMGHSLLHGADLSGKTALARHIVSSVLANSGSVLFIDLDDISLRGNVDKTLAKVYHEQFHGDYALWKNQAEKTVVLDNLSPQSESIDFACATIERFDRSIVLVPTDIYVTYYRGDERLAPLMVFQIQPLTRTMQEHLIRKRLSLMEAVVKDGTVDQVEKRVNSIMTGRLVPRYPFYVLSIIQTFEMFMPTDITITSHGHCYYVWIISRLMKAGVPNDDKNINTCLNFAEALALALYRSDRDNNVFSLERFIDDYNKTFIISESILNRLTHDEYGLLARDGTFQQPFMYYFFLGRYLASSTTDESRAIIEAMCHGNHIHKNHLTLLFIIHHASSDAVIEDIMLLTMCAMDEVLPARLDRQESTRFRDIIAGLNTDILSRHSVETERRAERDAIDDNDHYDQEDDRDSRTDSDMNRAFYQILKSNEILGQVLRVRYGKLRKEQIYQIVEAVADSGLRLVNAVLSEEKEIADLARYLHRHLPGRSERWIKSWLRFCSFLWTMLNVERIVEAVGHKEIRGIVNSVVKHKDTPAYDIIGYFCALDSADELTTGIRGRLRRLIKKYDDDFFVRGVLSIRTQHYMNTHRSTAKIAQGICSDLNIVYRHRLVPPSTEGRK